jgi:hypothetical protein
MTDSTVHRYRAFISYSQRDKHHAKRLHSSLETYRVPKGIEAHLQPNRRLGRFFRDDDEMGASTDLDATLRGAVEDSENLIVVCSPNAARSKWVNAEVAHFKSTGRGDRIFAVIVDGTPNSGDPESECFPPALHFEVTAGEPMAERHGEPLGVDLRKERFARARIRLAAGLMGISFDSLWQREKRRTAKRRSIAGLATLLLAAAIVILSAQWLKERDRVRTQAIDRALIGVRDDLASERVKDALVELDRLYGQGERGVVDDTLTSALSWVSTPTELLAEIKPPAFFTNGPQLFFIAANRTRHVVNIHQPRRSILSSDRRWLLILGADEALMLGVADGHELARTGSNQIEWIGQAFETSSGLLIVGGRFSGTTNGTFRESFLVFSARRKTLSVFDLHWNAENRSQYRFIHPLNISGDCRSFGVIREDYPFTDTNTELQPSDMFFFSADADGLKPMPPPDSVSGWRLAAMFDANDQLAFDRFKSGEAGLKDLGCIAPAADSSSPKTQPGAAGPVRPIGLGTSWEPKSRWNVTRRAGNSKPHAEPPCTEKSPCAVQDSESENLFPQFDFDVEPGWIGVTRPRGVHKDDLSLTISTGRYVRVS